MELTWSKLKNKNKKMKKTKKQVKSEVIKIMMIISLIAFIGVSTKNEAQNEPVTKELPKMVQSTAKPVLASNLSPTTTILAITEEPTDMKEWVKWKTGQAGLKWDDVNCLVSRESRWDSMAIYDNPNGAGVDRGLFMFSSIWHKEISNKDAFDYKKATEHFIKIVKKDKNYHQWWGYVNFCK